FGVSCCGSGAVVAHLLVPALLGHLPAGNEFEISSPSVVPGLPVLRRLQAQSRAYGCVNGLDRYQIDAVYLGAVHGERVNLARVTTVPERPAGIGDARREAHAAIAYVA